MLFACIVCCNRPRRYHLKGNLYHPLRQLVPSIQHGIYLHSLGPSSSSASEPTFDLFDLALMNHFTAVTSLTLFSGDKQGKFWQHEVPAMAASHPMVMYGLLAVAALHRDRSDMLGVKSPYRLRALSHHDAGLQLFNKQIPHVSSENSDVLFTFSVLLVVWVYASIATLTDEALRLDDILNRLDLVRGCATLFELQKATLLEKPMGLFADLRTSPSTRISALSGYEETLVQLHVSPVDSVHAEAMDMLQHSLRKYIKGFDSTKTATAWAAKVDEIFWARVKNHEPVVVIIFAHWSMLLRCCGYRYWWMRVGQR